MKNQNLKAELLKLAINANQKAVKKSRKNTCDYMHDKI